MSQATVTLRPPAHSDLAAVILPGDGGRASAGAEAVIDLANRYGFHRVDRLLSEWIDRRGLSS